MEFATAADLPIRRLPPLQIIHGQPVLDLDTPPPSASTSPDATQRDTFRFAHRSSLPQFSNEEINHSLHILQQCFEELRTGQHPCLRSRGRVSSAFGHNKHSILLAKLYSHLCSQKVKQAQLLFVRDCATRISQMKEFVNSIQGLVQEEERTFCNFLTGNVSEPHTRLDYLPVLCEDLSRHMNHLPSIHHRLHTDKWLQPALSQYFGSMHYVEDILRQLQLSAISWMQLLISIGLRVFSYFHVSMMSPELLQAIVYGIEDFNRLHKQFRLELNLRKYGFSQKPRCMKPPNSFLHNPNKFLYLQSFPFEIILSTIAKSRSRITAFRTFHFLQTNAKVLNFAKEMHPTFNWKKTFFSGSDSVYDTSSHFHFKMGNSAAMSRAAETLICFSEGESPLGETETSEEEFIVKFLTAAATSSGLLQKLKLQKSISSSREGADLDPISLQGADLDPISLQLDPDKNDIKATSTKSQNSAGTTSKRSSRLKRDSGLRKSVRWGDSLNSQLRSHLFGLYLTSFWGQFTQDFLGYLLDPSMEQKGGGEEFIGAIYLWHDQLLYHVTCAMEKTDKKKGLPPRVSSSLHQVATPLLNRAIMAAWDQGFCSGLGSSVKDKCLSSSQEGNKDITQTCQFYGAALVPLIATLARSRGRAAEIVPAFMVGWDSCGSCMDLPDMLLNRAIATIAAMTSWCQHKSSHFLQTWLVEQFLLISQGDLKFVMDHAVGVMKLCSPHQDGAQHDPQHRKDVAPYQPRTNLRHQAEEIISKLHVLSSWCSNQFGKDCQKMASEFWPQAMLVGKEWRRKTTEILPSKPNPYMTLAIITLLKPVTDGVNKLKPTAQITVVCMAITKMLQAWMNHILKERPKFSYHGACQLEQDLNHVYTWLGSDQCGLHPDTRQSVLALEAVRNFQGAIQLLKLQPQGRSNMGKSASKDELTSEYSVSTGASDFNRGSFVTLADASTYTPPTQQRLGHGHSAPTLVEQNDCDSEEDLSYVPRRKEWLSLRVHQGNRWRLGFGCLNNTGDIDSH